MMSQFLARLRTFQSPRVLIPILVIGVTGQVLAGSRMRTRAQSSVVRSAQLDTAIAAAMPAADDTTAATIARMTALVSEKRDLESAAQQRFLPWFVVSMLSGSLVLAAVVIGGSALLGHLRDGVERHAE
jgi:hypothetical protein